MERFLRAHLGPSTIAAVIAGLALAGCGAPAHLGLGAPGAGPSASPPPSSPASPGPPPANAIVLTAADSGSTVQLQLGQTLVLELDGSSSSPWRGPSDSAPTVLAPRPVLAPASLPAGSVYEEYSAVTAGTARLSAVRVPSCASQTPGCEVLELGFFAVVDVSTG
ncbi:MAG: hypothetical protein ACREOD_00275 [Candidatus Dormibacteria bacterium]